MTQNNVKFKKIKECHRLSQKLARASLTLCKDGTSKLANVYTEASTELAADRLKCLLFQYICIDFECFINLAGDNIQTNKKWV